MSSTLPLIRVLVVNDQREMCELWQRMIDMAPGLSCPAYALNGDDVLPLVDKLRPDVLFMDVQLPGLSGVEITRRIAEKHPRIIVILHAAYDYNEEQAYEVGAAEFIALPIETDKLTSIIRRVYREHRNPNR